MVHANHILALRSLLTTCSVCNRTHRGAFSYSYRYFSPPLYILPTVVVASPSTRTIPRPGSHVNSITTTGLPSSLCVSLRTRNATRWTCSHALYCNTATPHHNLINRAVKHRHDPVRWRLLARTSVMNYGCAQGATKEKNKWRSVGALILKKSCFNALLKNKTPKSLRVQQALSVPAPSTTQRRSPTDRIISSGLAATSNPSDLVPKPARD